VATTSLSALGWGRVFMIFAVIIEENEQLRSVSISVSMPI
ncbi:hypothetical protein CP8484711_0294, partial [Chlamydia psittaci 84-8471/1]